MLLAGPNFHTGIQYMDFAELCLIFLLLVLVGVDLSLCLVVTLP